MGVFSGKTIDSEELRRWQEKTGGTCIGSMTITPEEAIYALQQNMCCYPAEYPKDKTMKKIEKQKEIIREREELKSAEEKLEKCRLAQLWAEANLDDFATSQKYAREAEELEKEVKERKKKWRERVVDKEPAHKGTSATVDYEWKALCIAKKLKTYDEFVGGLNGISWALDNTKRAILEIEHNEQVKDKEVDDKEFGKVSILHLLKVVAKILDKKVMPYVPEMIETTMPREEMSSTDAIKQIEEFNKAALKRYEKTKEESGHNMGPIDFPYREVKEYFANCGYVITDKWKSDYNCGISYPIFSIVGEKKKGERE